MLELSDLFIGMLLIGFLMLWWNAQGAKQIALRATRLHCQKLDVQLLDDVVALRGFWFKRDGDGRMRLWRSYNFEFTSTGNDRYRGRVILLGRRVESILMDPYRVH